MSTFNVYINLESMIFRAYNLGRNSDREEEPMTKAQLRQIILMECPAFAKTVVGEVSESEKAQKPTKTREEKPRAAPKPRAIPEDDTRCCARSFYEKDHTENGKLKVMRDDADNLYGDRCKFKKVGDGDFCKHHEKAQPHGVWDGEYEGKFKMFKEPAHEDKKPKSKTVVAASSSKVSSKTSKPAAKHEDTDSGCSDDEYHGRSTLAAKGIKTESIEIDDMTYAIDKDGNVYDPEDDDDRKIGVWDRKAKKWISGGHPSHPSEEELDD